MAKKNTTALDIDKGNKVISDFMGEKLDLNQWGENWKRVISLHTGLTQIPKYHASWDWLMPVITKIKKTLEGNIDDWTFKYERRIYDSLKEVNIYDTWKHIVGFINDYNKHYKKKKNARG